MQMVCWAFQKACNIILRRRKEAQNLHGGTLIYLIKKNEAYKLGKY